MAEYDTISKHLIQTYPKDFIRFTLGQDNVEVLNILDTEQNTVETRHTDSLIRVHIAGKEALIHHEFQTTDDPSMPIRMAGYIIRAIEQHNLPVYSSVIYLRRGAGRRDPGHFIQEISGRPVVIEYTVIRLSEIEGQDILNGGPSGLFPFTTLMKRPDRMDSDEWFCHCVDATNGLPVDESIKVDFLGRMMILSGLVYDPAFINRILLQEGLMDAIMRESSFAQYIKQLGIEQGIEQGGRQRAIEDLLDVLEIRFDLSETHPLSTRIAAIDDLRRLKQLLRAAIQVSNLEAFEQALDA
ncbi:MAG: Rpn family recombination-promoting nuclease/putative transposase [Gemmatimonadetes bacterium]|nr:Rpn family recombination-promoting nuclease/putative transposase [Gemmatimonadota bacterium]